MYGPVCLGFSEGAGWRIWVMHIDGTGKVE